jgi:hypothetical protein
VIAAAVVGCGVALDRKLRKTRKKRIVSEDEAAAVAAVPVGGG